LAANACRRLHDERVRFWTFVAAGADAVMLKSAAASSKRGCTANVERVRNGRVPLDGVLVAGDGASHLYGARRCSGVLPWWVASTKPVANIIWRGERLSALIDEHRRCLLERRAARELKAGNRLGRSTAGTAVDLANGLDGTRTTGLSG